jgi:hypothetical protein
MIRQRAAPPYSVVLQGITGYGTASYIAPPTLVQTWAPSPSMEWVFDSGATAHLSKDAGILHTLSPHPVHRPITVGDGSSIPVSSSGHASFPSSFLSNRPLYLCDVLITPRIIKNLISVRQFTIDNNFSVDFDPFGFSVKDLLTRHELLWCNSTRELYSFEHPVPRALTTTTTSHDI